MPPIAPKTQPNPLSSCTRSPIDSKPSPTHFKGDDRRAELRHPCSRPALVIAYDRSAAQPALIVDLSLCGANILTTWIGATPALIALHDLGSATIAQYAVRWRRNRAMGLELIRQLSGADRRTFEPICPRQLALDQATPIAAEAQPDLFPAVPLAAQCHPLTSPPPRSPLATPHAQRRPAA